MKKQCKVCGYCGGKIYWHLVNKTFWGSEEWEAEGIDIEGKDYHRWCATWLNEKTSQ